MPSLSEAIIGDANSYVCRVMDNTTARNNIVQRAARRFPGGSRLVDGLSQGREALRDFACGAGGANQPADPGDVFPDPPAFTGGQCDGEEYVLTATFEGTQVSNGTQLGPVTRSANAIGPIRSLTPINPDLGGFNGFIWGLTFTATTILGANWPSGPRVDPNSVLGVNLGLSANDEFETGFLVGQGGGGGFVVNPINILSATVSRVDGMPDNCGDDPSNSSLPSGSGTLDYDDANNNPVSEPFTREVRDPILDLNGNLILPIVYGTANFNVTANVNLNIGEVGLSFNLNGPGADNCCPPVETPDGEPEGEPEDPPPPADDTRFVGVFVKANLPSTGGTWTEIGDGIGPNLFVPRLGVISFGIELGGKLMWTQDQDIRKEREFIPVNAPATAYTFAIFEEPGVTFDVDKIFVEQ